MNPDEPVIVARIARAHGIEGGLLLDVETDHAEALFQPGRRLRVVGDASPHEGLTVRAARPHGARWRLQVEEIRDRTAAEAVRGRELTVPRGELPDMEPGDYLLHDLIGMRVLDAGAELGAVTDVYELPSGPMLAVAIGGVERLIPFAEGFVEQIDLEGETVHMKLPKGLLEI